MNTIEQTDEFETWLDNLADTVAQKTIAREIVKMQGGLFGDVKHIEGKVWEKRIDMGPGYRLYYKRNGSTLYLLLCGGTKRRQQADIDEALKLSKRDDDENDDDGDDNGQSI